MPGILSTAGAATDVWNTTTSGSWQTNSNWSTGILPGSGDSAVLSNVTAGTIIVSNQAATTITQLTMVQTTANATNELFLTAALTIAGNTVPLIMNPGAGTGNLILDLNGNALTISNNAASYTATLNGTVYMESGSTLNVVQGNNGLGMIFSNAGVLAQNNSTVNYILSGSQNDPGYGRRFVNTGTWILTNNSAFYYNSAFQWGTVLAPANSGTLILADSSTLTFGSYLVNTGYLQLSGTNATLGGGSYNAANSLSNIGSGVVYITGTNAVLGTSIPGMLSGAAFYNGSSSGAQGATLTVGNGTNAASFFVEAPDNAISLMLVNNVGNTVNVSRAATLGILYDNTGNTTGYAYLTNNGVFFNSGTLQFQPNFNGNSTLNNYGTFSVGSGNAATGVVQLVQGNSGQTPLNHFYNKSTGVLTGNGLFLFTNSSTTVGNNYLDLQNAGTITPLAGGSLTLSNVAFVNNAGTLLANGSTLTIGGIQVTNAAGTIVVANGGAWFSPGLASAGGSVIITGGPSVNIFSNTGAVIIGDGVSDAGSGTLVISNANAWSAGLTIGSGSSNNTVTANAGTAWNLLGGQLIYGTATGNVLTLNPGAVLTNVGGIAMNGSGASLLLTNATGQGNLYLDSAGALTVGGVAGWGGNTLIISNQTFSTAAANTIGNNSSNNALTILTNTVWNTGAQALTIGTGPATGDVLTVNGGIVTNAGAVVIGNSATSIGNSLAISNGGQFFSGNLTVGNAVGASNNAYNIGGFGASSTVSNGNVIIGVAGAGFNTMTITNASLVTSPIQTINLGNNSSNNTISILSGGTWTAPAAAGGGSRLNIGNGIATGNVVTVNGGTLNMGYIYVGGGAGANGNSLYVTNGTVNTTILALPSQTAGLVLAQTSNSITLVGNSVWTGPGQGLSMSIGGVANTLLVNNSMLTNFSYLSLQGVGNIITLTNNAKLFITPDTYSAASQIGSSAADSNNTVYVLAGSLYSDSSGQLNQNGISHLGGSNNQIVINGGTYVNSTIVGMAGIYSGVTVTNGLFTAPGVNLYTGSSVPGSSVFGSNDFFNVLGGGTANLLAAAMNIGAGNGLSNSVTVNGGILTNVGLITLGYGPAPNSPAIAAITAFNTMTVTNGTVSSAGLTIGNASSNNTVTVSAGSTWNFGAGVLTYGAGTGNVLTLNPGAVLTNVGGIAMNGSGASLLLTNVAGQGNLYLDSVGALNIGGTAGMGGNTLLISNQAFSVNAASTIGNGSSNNILTILANTVWNNGAQALTIGTGTATGDVLTINGGIMTNAGAVAIGASATSIGNSLAISNGGQFVSGNLTVGSANGGNNNAYNVGGLGTASTASNGTVGFAGTGNSITVSNGTLITSAGSSILGTNNSINILAGGTWAYANPTNNDFTMSSGSGSNNTVNINGGVVTNIRNIYISGGTAGSGSASVALTNGGKLFLSLAGGGTGMLLVGYGGAGTLTISDTSFISAGGGLYVGGVFSTGGQAGGTGVLIQTGGTISDSQVFLAGSGSTAQYTMSGGSNFSAGVFYVGGAGTGQGGNGTLTLSGSAYIQSVGAELGRGQNTSGGTGTVFQSGGTWNVGGALTIGNNGTLSFGTYSMTGGVLSNVNLNVGGNGGSGLMTIGASANIQGNGGNFTVSAGGAVNQTGGVVNANNSPLYINSGTYVDSGGVLTNVQFVALGNQAAFGTLTISNGGVFSSAGGVYVSYNNSTTASNNTYNVGGLGALSTVSNSFIQLGYGSGANAASGGNVMNVTNANLWSGGLTTGYGSSNNVVNVYSNATYNLLGGAINIGNQTYVLSNGMTIYSGGIVTNASGLAVGSAAGANNNSFIASGGQFFMNSGTLAVGATALGGAGGNGNTVLLSNSIINATGQAWVGNASSSNTLTVANTLWNNGGNALTIGTGVATGNVLTVSGGTVTNLGAVVIGNSATSLGNSLAISNGGQFVSGAVTVGNAAGATSNAYNVGGFGAISSVSNGAITVGVVGAGYSTMTVTNATLLSSGAVSIGNGLLALNGGAFTVNNSLNVGLGQLAVSNGALTVTNYGGVGGVVTIGSTGQSTLTFNNGTIYANDLLVNNNSLAATNSFFSFAGGTLTTSNATTGAGSQAADIVLYSNQTFNINGVWNMTGGTNATRAAWTNNNGAGTVVVGNGASNAAVNVGPLAVWTFATNGTSAKVNLLIGNGAATGDMVNVTGGALTNVGFVTVGSGGATGNTLTVSAGGSLVMTGLALSATAADANNSVIVNGAVVSNSGVLNIYGVNNRFSVTNGGLVMSGAFGIGAGAGANSNVVSVTGASAMLNMLAQAMNVGSANATGNVLQIGTGGIVSNLTTLTVGTVAGEANRIQMAGGALSAASVLVNSNSVLAGNGSISVNSVAGLTLTNGALLAPGMGSTGTLTLNSLNWQGGATYDLLLTNFGSGVGIGWGMLNVTGGLSNTYSSAGSYVIRLDSLGANATGFYSNSDYSIQIANFNVATSALATNLFKLDTSTFSNPMNSAKWSLAQIGGSLYLDYTGDNYTNSANYVWSSTGGNWSTAANWTNNSVPPGAIPLDQLRLQFGTNSTTAFTATNNNVVTALNAIILNSGTTGTNTLTGGALTFTGGVAVVDQQNSGMFIISNSVTLATNLTLFGPGVGQVTLASNITGTGQITKNGSWNLVLQGFNTFAGPVVVDSAGGTLTIGNLSALGTNSLTVSNGTVLANLAGTSFIVGNGWSNQAVVIAGTVSVWTNVGAFNIGAGLAQSNVVTVTDGGSLVAGAVTIGNSATAQANSLLVSNGAGFISGAITIGGSNNSYNVGGGVTAASASNGAITVGNAGAGNDAMTVTNANLLSGGLTVGNTSSTNVVSVLANGNWNLLGNAGTIGTGAANGNVVVINGGTVTNAGAVYIGYSATSVGNSLTISNGGQFFNSGAVALGSSGASNNFYNVGGQGASSTASNGSVTFGASGFNTMTVTNATLLLGANLTIGNGSSNNTVNVLSNSTWNMVGHTVTIGTGAATGNVLTINSATVTNLSTVAIGASATAIGNSLVVSNSSVNAAGINVATTGGYSNSIVLINSSWNANVNGLVFGMQPPPSVFGNSLTVNGGILTNFNGLQIFGVGNTITLTNNAQVWTAGRYNSQGDFVGSNNSQSNNTIYILAGSVLNDASTVGWWISGSWSNGGTASGGTSNQIVVNGGTLNGAPQILGYNSGITVTNGTVSGGLNVSGYGGDFINVLSNGTWIGPSTLDMTLGNYAGAVSNVMTINGGVVSNSRDIYVAYHGSASLIMTNGAKLSVNGSNGASFIGYFGDSSGTLTISDTSIFSDLGGLSVGANAGATGVVLQSGGTINTGGSAMNIGGGGGSARYTMTNGTLLAGLVTVGNLGTLTISGNSSIQSAGLTINAGGVVTQYNGTWVLGGSTWLINGADTLLGGVVSNTGQLAGNGTLTVGGSAYVQLGGKISSGGSINQTGGVLNANGNIIDSNGSFTYVINGALATNFGNILLGDQGAFASLTISNGGVLVSTGIVEIAYNNSLAASNNSYNVGGLGFSSTVSNLGQIQLGYYYLGTTGGGNQMVVTNANLVTSGNVTVGSNSSSNSVAVNALAQWNLLGANINIGNGASGISNVFTISGGTVSNVNVLTVGSATGAAGTLTFNSGTLVVNQLLSVNNVVGGATNSFFTGIGSGATLITSNTAGQIAANIVIPTNQSFTVSGTWLMEGGTNLMTSATGANPNGFFVVSGGTVIVTNGAQFVTSLGSVFREQNGATVTVVGAGSYLTNNNSGGMQIGMSGNYSVLNILNGGIAVNNSVASIGAGNSNAVLVSGIGSVWSNTGSGSGYGNLPISGYGSSLTVSNGGYVYIASSSIGESLDVGENGTNNWALVTGSGSVITNKGNLSIGFFSGNNWLTIANSGAVYNTSAYMSPRADNSGNNLITVTDTGSVWKSSGTVYMSGDSSVNPYYGNSNNIIIVSNGALAVSAGLVVGNKSNNNLNAVTVTGPGSVWTNTGVTTVGAAYDTFNKLTVTNGGAYYGNGAVTIGNGANASNNSLNVIGNNGVSTFSNNAMIIVGTAGGNNNRLFATNALMFGGLDIGDGSASNTVTVQDNVTWDFLGYDLKFGAGTNNALNLTQVSSTYFTNVGGVILGNAGQTFALTNVSGVVARDIILGAGGTISVGDTAGWGNNKLLISNQTFTAGGAGFVGNNSSNNALTVLANTTWNNNAQAFTIGTGTAANNVLTNNGDAMTGFGAFTIGANAGAVSNGLVLNNGGTLTGTTLTIGNTAGANSNYYNVGGVGAASYASNGVIVVGNAGAAYNTLTISNATLLSYFSGHSFYIGAGSASNTVTILANGVLNLQGTTADVGSGGSSSISNWMIINGGVVSNGALMVGGGVNAGGNQNTLLITNGGAAYTAGSFIGNWNATNNLAIVTGPGSVWQLGASLALGNGNAPASGNQLIIANGGVVSNSGNADTIGTGAFNTSNSVLVTGAGSVWSNTGLYVGNSPTNAFNSLTVSNGGLVSVTYAAAGGLTIGGGMGSVSNTVTVTGTNSVMTSVVNSVLIGNGANASYNSLTVSNGGQFLNSSAMTIGAVAGANSNTVIVTGGGYLQGAALTVGTAGSTGNVLQITGGATNWDTGVAISTSALDWGNGVNVAGGALIVSNAANNAQINVGQNGGGALTLNSGTISVNQLLVTNNTAAGATSSIFTFAGGTLNTSNATGAVAANIVVASNSTFNINGVWNMNGGTNNVGGLSSQQAGGGVAAIGFGANNAAVNVATNAVWNLMTPGSGNNNIFIYIGNTTADSNDVLTINGGQVVNLAGVNINGSYGGIVISNNGAFVQTSGGDSKYATGSGGFDFQLSGNHNFITLAGGTFSNSGSFGFYGGSYNTFTVLSNSTAYENGNFSIAGNNGTVLVSGTNANFVSTGLFGVNGANGMLIVSNGGLFTVNQLAPGWQAATANANNQVIVTGTGSVLRSGSTILYSFNSGNFGGGGNSITVMNGGLLSAGGINMDDDGSSGGGWGSNNVFTVAAGGSVSNSNGLYLGGQWGGSNQVYITGAGSVWSNWAGVTVANGYSYSGNNVFMVNSNSAFYGITGAFNVGGAANQIGSGSNLVQITSATFSNSGLVSVGQTASNDWNTLTVTNSAVWSGGLTIGTGGDSNAVTVLSNTTWNMLGGNLTIGSGVANSNTLSIVGSSVSNVGVLNIAGAATGIGALNFNGGTLSVNSLLITNNLNGGPTNSIFNWTAGTLITSNAVNGVASLIELGSTTFNMNNAWSGM